MRYRLYGLKCFRDNSSNVFPLYYMFGSDDTRFSLIDSDGVYTSYRITDVGIQLIKGKQSVREREYLFPHLAYCRKRREEEIPSILNSEYVGNVSYRKEVKLSLSQGSSNEIICTAPDISLNLPQELSLPSPYKIEYTPYDINDTSNIQYGGSNTLPVTNVGIDWHVGMQFSSMNDVLPTVTQISTMTPIWQAYKDVGCTIPGINLINNGFAIDLNNSSSSETRIVYKPSLFNQYYYGAKVNFVYGVKVNFTSSGGYNNTIYTISNITLLTSERMGQKVVYTAGGSY